MKDRYLAATRAVEDYGRKLDAIYRVHGRDGLRSYSGADVCVLYWCLQNDLESLSSKIESGKGHQSDVLIKEQLTAKLKDLHVDLIEKHGREQEQGMER
jgi:hypothetical protein